MLDEAEAADLSLMDDLARALDTGEISLAHQPKYDYRTGRIDSAEALVRWAHPSRGLVFPDLFVPLAEETGHIRLLTEWVLERAVRDQRALSDAGRPLILAVNISARLLSDGAFAQHALKAVRAAAHQICFEITETAVIDNPELAREHLELFAQKGVRIAIDDYGAGLSLGYLKQLPAHELKLDKMFAEKLVGVDGLEQVRAIIELAHGLGLEVTAEGIETPAAFAVLAEMGCDLAQGHLVGQAGSVEELLALLGDENRLRYYRQAAAGETA